MTPRKRQERLSRVEFITVQAERHFTAVQQKGIHPPRALHYVELDAETSAFRVYQKYWRNADNYVWVFLGRNTCHRGVDTN